MSQKDTNRENPFERILLSGFAGVIGGFSFRSDFSRLAYPPMRRLIKRGSLRESAS
jgi:hypothetical protein